MINFTSKIFLLFLLLDNDEQSRLYLVVISYSENDAIHNFLGEQVPETLRFIE